MARNANRVNKGYIHVEIQTDGSLYFTVADHNGKKISVQSARVSVPNRFLKIGVTCRFPEKLQVVANGQKIADLKEKLPEFIEFPIVEWPKFLRNYSQENDQAQKLRTKSANELQPENGKRLRTLEEEVVHLDRAMKQLVDLISLIESGKHYHIHACTALIRSLIAKGKKNFRPLLQRVVGRLDKPILVYASLHSPQELSPTEDYNFTIQPSNKDNLSLCCIDLDVWLNSRAGIYAGNEFTQNELIRTLADATASHFDPYSDPLLDRLESIKMFAQNQSFAIATSHALLIARTIVPLADTLFEAYYESVKSPS